MFRRLSRLVFFLLVVCVQNPAIINAQGCTLAVSISNSFASGDLKNCGFGGSNSITFTVTKDGHTDIATIPGTHGGYNLSGSGTVCVKGTSDGLSSGSQEVCQSFGSGQSQPPPQQPTTPPPPNNGGGGSPQPNPDVPFVGQQNQPSGSWVQAQTEPLYVYNGQSTSSQVIAKVHAGMYLSLNGTSNGWTQVLVNGGIGYVPDGNGQSVRNTGGSQPPSNSGGGSNPYSVGRLGDGGLDVERICGVTGQHATNDGQHAYSWGCNGNILNKNATCAQVWPEYPYARVVGGLAGWSCHSSPQTQEQPSPDNSGNNGSSSGGSNGGSGGGNPNPPLVVGCPLSTRLHVGGEGQVIVPNLTFRNGAGTDKGYVLTMQKGDVFSVVGGPICTGGRYWWNITFLNNSGWIAEGGATGYFTQPVTTAQIPPMEIPASGCIPTSGCMERKDGNSNAWWADEWHLGHCNNQTDTDWIVTYNTNAGAWLNADPNKIHFYAPITSIVRWYKDHAQVEDASLPGITLCMSGHMQATDVENSWVWLDN